VAALALAAASCGQDGDGAAASDQGGAVDSGGGAIVDTGGAADPGTADPGAADPGAIDLGAADPAAAVDPGVAADAGTTRAPGGPCGEITEMGLCDGEILWRCMPGEVGSEPALQAWDCAKAFTDSAGLGRTTCRAANAGNEAVGCLVADGAPCAYLAMADVGLFARNFAPCPGTFSMCVLPKGPDDLDDSYCEETYTDYCGPSDVLKSCMNGGLVLACLNDWQPNIWSCAENGGFCDPAAGADNAACVLGAGSKCDGQYALCEAGLVCDPAEKVCKAR
jgi:hypothetical protein